MLVQLPVTRWKRTTALAAGRHSGAREQRGCRERVGNGDYARALAAAGRVRETAALVGLFVRAAGAAVASVSAIYLGGFVQRFALL